MGLAATEGEQVGTAFMSNYEDDPTPELYAILDEAKLSGGTFLQGKKNMTQIVNEIRADLVMKLRSYVKRRDQAIFNKGVQKGKSDAGN